MNHPLTPYQQWLNGLMLDDRLDQMELAWMAALEWAKLEMEREGLATPTTVGLLKRGME